MAKLTPQQRITRSSVQLMRSKQFCLLSGILVMGKREIKEGCGTAYTNGRDTYFDPKFIETLNEKQLNFLTAHEAWHIALKQITTYKKLWQENPRLCNQAADYVANIMIVDADPNGEIVQFIEGGCLDEKYRGWNTKQVFDDLLQNPPPEGGSGSGGEPYDEHDFESGDEMTEVEKQALEKAVDEALRQGTLLAGKMGGNVDRSIQQMLEPKVDWREELRDFVAAISNEKEMSTWRKPSRRHLHTGTYLPSMYSETVGDIVVGIDTSGSIGSEELSQFLGEVQRVCELTNPSKLHILWWDTEVAGVDEFDQNNYEGLANRVKPAGGGGTDVACVFKYVDEHGLKPEAAIILTDGYTPWCDAPKYPTLFAMNTRVVAPFGKTVRIES